LYFDCPSRWEIDNGNTMQRTVFSPLFTGTPVRRTDETPESVGRAVVCYVEKVNQPHLQGEREKMRGLASGFVVTRETMRVVEGAEVMPMPFAEMR